MRRDAGQYKGEKLLDCPVPGCGARMRHRHRRVNYDVQECSRRGCGGAVVVCNRCGHVHLGEDPPTVCKECFAWLECTS